MRFKDISKTCLQALKAALEKTLCSYMQQSQDGVTGCHFSARDDTSGEAETQGMVKKVSVWHSYNSQGQRKGCCSNQGTSN